MMKRTALSLTVAVVIVVLAWTFGAALLRSRGENRMFATERVTVEHVAALKGMAPSYGMRAQQAALKVEPPMTKGVRGRSGPALAPQLARTGEIDLLVGNVERATKAVSSLVRRESGDVLSLDAQSTSEGTTHPTAQLQARIPASRFDDALLALQQFGKLRSHSVQAEDLSTQIVDTTARLRNLRRTEGDILRIMDRSGSVSQVLEAENQLSSVREQIETLDAESKEMHARIAYSTIRISLEAEATSNPAEPSALAQLGNAWRAALHGVGQFTVGLVAIAIWLAAFLPYGILVAAILWFLRTRRAARGAAS